MNNIFTTFWLTIFGVATYMFILIPILMEIALAKPKRTPDGRLRLRRESFVIQNMYKINFMENNRNKTYPQNLCRLYWGLVFGAFFSVIMGVLVITIGGGNFIVSIITTFFGYVPAWQNKYRDFHPYQRFGKNDEKKFIAPWKFALVAGIIFFIYNYPKVTLSGAKYCGSSFSSALLSILASKYFWSIIAIIILIMIAEKISETEKWAAAKDILKSIKNKACPMIELVEAGVDNDIAEEDIE